MLLLDILSECEASNSHNSEMNHPSIENCIIVCNVKLMHQSHPELIFRYIRGNGTHVLTDI